MDRDDPEKRIAELERQLAAEKRGTDLPPASLDHAAVSGRFVAFPAPPGTKQMYKFMYGSIAVYVALMFVISIAGMTLGSKFGRAGYILPAVFALGILVIGGIVLFLRFPRFFGRADRDRKSVV